MESLVHIAAQIAALLEIKSQKLTTAESCTAGGISYVLTEVPGSSAWFERAFVTYSSQAKQEMLGVSESTLLTYGEVSEEVVLEMAQGALIRANADIALAVSGIAGPSGGSVDKPVGMVCFAWAHAGNVFTQTCQFEGDRHHIRRDTIAHSLRRLLLCLETQKTEQ